MRAPDDYAHTLLEAQRRAVWQNLTKNESRQRVILELLHRFGLLRDQYKSDMRRLDGIMEAGVRLGQLQTERCPVCGAPADQADHEHSQPQPEPGVIVAACRAESAKIQNLAAELEHSIRDNEQEINELEAERKGLQEQLDGVVSEIEALLESRVHATLQQVQSIQAELEKYRHAISLYDRVAELEQLRSESRPRKLTAPPSDNQGSLGADEAEQFSKEVEALLRDWRFPDLDRVTFSEADQDLIVSGQKRASHGKGVRALTHAAFNLALMNYCRERGMPHPGLVLLDSPLVVYREPDPDEDGFALDVKTAFFQSLSTRFANSQVVIFENVDPPTEIAATANVISFTGGSTGRSGFIPSNST